MDNLVAECIAEVLKAPNRWLGFASRRKMLLSLGPTWQGLGVAFEDLLNDHYEMGLAHRRRALIAVQAADRAAPFWAAHFDEDHPQRMIRGARDVIAGVMNRRQLRKDAKSFQGTGLASGAEPTETGYGFLYAGHAAACAANVAIWDEYLEPDDSIGMTQRDVEDPEDVDWWDSAAFAAAACAGEFPWGEERWYHPDRSEQFWLWYLREAIPGVMYATR